MGNKFPTPWKTVIVKFPPPRDSKGVECPGYAWGMPGGMLKLWFDRYINIESKYFNTCFCLIHKIYSIQTNSVSFHQPNIYKKYSVYVCLLLKKCVPFLLYEVRPEIWKMYNCFFPLRQPLTILSTICVPLNCELKIIRMQCPILLLITSACLWQLFRTGHTVSLAVYCFGAEIGKIYQSSIYPHIPAT